MINPEWEVTASHSTKRNKEMKKLFVFAMVATVLTIFNGCQKDEEALVGGQLQVAITDPLFAGLDTIIFSVEKNCLVFESEREFQKCINFLAQLGDKNFPAFETYIGFDSYRKVFEDDEVKSSVFVDELYQTLLNPEMEIVVGSYLFRENPDNKTTLAFELENDKECNLKNAASYDFSFSWDDEAFAILSGKDSEPRLKAGCTGNHDHKKDWVIQSATYPPPVPNAAYAYKAEVSAKLCFQTTALFKSIISKIKTESFKHEGTVVNGQLFTIKISQEIDHCYDRNNENIRRGDWSHYKITNASQDEVAWRPFYGTKRVNCYNVHSTFKWEVYSNWLAPQYSGQYETVSFIEDCEAGGCPL